MKQITLLSIFFIYALPGCKDNTTGSSPSGAEFALYQLRDSTISAAQAWNMPLDSLELKSVPFFTAADIKSYSWSQHAFVAQPRVDSIFSSMSRLSGPSTGIPFVVTTGKVPIYLGAFWWGYSSLVPQTTYIEMLHSSPYQLKHEEVALLPDRRSDKRIHDALQAVGVLTQ